MVVKGVLAAALCLACLPLRPALAQAPAPPGSGASAGSPAARAAASQAPAPDDGEQALPDRVTRRWFELKELLDSQAGDGSTEKLGELRKLREEAGVRALPAVARALTVEGFRALDRAELETAEARFSAALELSPAAADARLGLAAVERRRGALTAFVSDLLRAMRSRLASSGSAPFAASSLLFLLTAGLFLAGMLAIAALLVRKQGLVRHDVEEAVKHRFEPELGRVLGWVVLLLPLLLTFDLYWAALYWGVLVWAYLGAKEQAVLVASLLFCALLVPALGLGTRLVANAADPYTSAAIAYLDGLVDAPTLRALEQHVAAHPEAVEGQVLLALIHEKNGQPRKAIEHYRALLDRRKGPEILNNLANVYYRLDEKDQAFSYWTKALEQDPAFAPALYNLSVYYSFFFEFDRKEEYFKKARAIDAKLVERAVGSGPGVIDSGVDRAEIRRRLWEPPRQEADPLRAALGSPQVIGAAVALVLGAVLARKRAASGVAAFCDKCGRPFCGDCKPGKERDNYCLQCVHMFLRKDGVSPQMRAEKLKETGRNQFLRRVASAVLGLLAPGAGQVYRARPLVGFLFLIAWGMSLAVGLLGARTLREPGFVARAADVVPVSAALAVAGLVWLVANATNLLRKD